MNNWWRGAVTYQIYPRSFQDSNGDGIGDLPGITSRLEYVAELGVDAIWLSPIFTSPMADMGYDVSNYTDIDPLFGTLADFDKLLAKSHKLGMKVKRSSLVHRKSGVEGQPEIGLVCLGRTELRRYATDKLAIRLWRTGLGIRRDATAVLFAQLSGLAARSEFPQSRRARCTIGHYAVLAGSWRGWVSAGHGQLLFPRQNAAR